MDFKSNLLVSYRFNLRYAEALVVGVPVGREAESLGPGLENHPVWILGHLCTGAAMLAEDLGGSNTLDATWRELFERRGPNDERLPDGGVSWPSLAETLSELRRQHGLVEEGLMGFPESRLGDKEGWRLGEYLPTMADVITFMAITHEAIHLGQFAAGGGRLVWVRRWRRYRVSDGRWRKGGYHGTKYPSASIPKAALCAKRGGRWGCSVGFIVTVGLRDLLKPAVEFAV